MWQEGPYKKGFHISIHGSSGNLLHNKTVDLPEWVTKKHVVSYGKDKETSTMTIKNMQYNWCNYFHNGNGKWSFHWKNGHKECK